MDDPQILALQGIKAPSWGDKIIKLVGYSVIRVPEEICQNITGRRATSRHCLLSGEVLLCGKSWEFLTARALSENHRTTWSSFWGKKLATRQAPIMQCSHANWWRAVLSVRATGQSQYLNTVGLDEQSVPGVRRSQPPPPPTTIGSALTRPTLSSRGKFVCLWAICSWSLLFAPTCQCSTYPTSFCTSLSNNPRENGFRVGQSTAADQFPTNVI